jgi:hypothetical protein
MNWSKLGSRVRQIGQKIVHGVRSIGSKVSSVALRAAPALAAINPNLGAAAAAVGGVAGGVASIAGVADGVLSGKESLTADTVNSVKSQAAAVRSAYSQGRKAVGSMLERSR